jgi:hypothetical protein
MGQKHKIRYGYQTGNSYGSESLEWAEIVVDNSDMRIDF